MAAEGRKWQRNGNETTKMASRSSSRIMGAGESQPQQQQLQARAALGHQSKPAPGAPQIENEGQPRITNITPIGNSLEPTLTGYEPARVDTVWEVCQRGIRGYPDQACLATRTYGEVDEDGVAERGEYIYESYSLIGKKAEAFGRALVKLGLVRNNHVGIFSPNRAEWTISALGCYSQTFRVVSLYHTLGAEAWAFILTHADLHALIVFPKEMQAVLQHLQQAQAKGEPVESLRLLIQLDADPLYGNRSEFVPPEAYDAATKLGIRIMGFSEVLKLGSTPEQARIPLSLPKPDDIAFIMYTSGTTGVPKGAMLSHKAVARSATVHRLGRPGDRYFSYLPMAHILESVCHMLKDNAVILLQCIVLTSQRRGLEEESGYDCASIFGPALTFLLLLSATFLGAKVLASAEKKKTADRVGMHIHFYTLPCICMYPHKVEYKWIYADMLRGLRNTRAVSHAVDVRFHMHVQYHMLWTGASICMYMSAKVQYHMLWTGASIHFAQGDVKLLADDLQEVKPTIFPAVPRVLRRFYDRIFAGVAEANWVKRMYFHHAYNSVAHAIKNGLPRPAQADNNVFIPLRTQRLGLGSCRLVLTGAAPCPSYIFEFVQVVLGAAIIQGYGLTESAACCSLMMPDDKTAGHVGPPAPGVEVKLVDVPEMAYRSSDRPCPRGEVVIRSETNFLGYYKDAEDTKRVLQNGWLYTGDIGRWNADGTLSIIDRRKNIFKLAQGEYVAVEKVEDAYQKAASVNQIWVYGDSMQPHLVAVVVPDADWLKQFAKGQGWWRPRDDTKFSELENIREILEDEKTNVLVAAAMQQLLEAAAVEANLAGFEKIKRFHIESNLDHEMAGFTVANGMITPTHKLRRHQLKTKYEDVIFEMYKSIETGPSDSPAGFSGGIPCCSARYK
eukprot:g32481.t1